MNKQFYDELTQDIKDAYEKGVTLDEAERLAAKFLYAQVQVGDELRAADLDARMRKSGVKTIKAAVYLEHATKSDKKPSDVMLGALVDKDELVSSEQAGLDTAEVNRDRLEGYLSVFREAHIFMRGVSKGRFE